MRTAATASRSPSPTSPSASRCSSPAPKGARSSSWIRAPQSTRWPRWPSCLASRARRCSSLLALSPSPGEAFREDDFVSVPLLGVDEERGSIETGVQVPEGHSVSFTLRDGMGARRTMAGALQRLAGAVPAFGVYFDCASRGTNLYGVGGLDMGLIEKSLGSFPLLSLRTSFELGPSGQGTGLH